VSLIIGSYLQTTGSAANIHSNLIGISALFDVRAHEPTQRRALWRAVERNRARCGVSYYAKTKKGNYKKVAARCGVLTGLKGINPFHPLFFFLISNALNFFRWETDDVAFEI
jgi:hypothetical protein